MLEKIAVPRVRLTGVAGQTEGHRLAGHERGHVGLFDIVVDHYRRNQGLARRPCQALLAWAQREDAHAAYLAVMIDNAPALHLYARLGLREVYQYWYRHTSVA